MTSLARLSVVIPTHARNDLLCRAVASVLRQTVLPYEIIVVDDVGSEDTREAVMSWDRGGAVVVKYVVNENKNGPSGSRNLGAHMSSCAVLAFLDDDDVWCVDYVEYMLPHMANADAVFAPLRLRHIDRSGNVVLQRDRRLHANMTSDAVLAHNPGVGGSNIVIDRDVFLGSGGFDESLWVGEDSEFVSRLLAARTRIAIARTGLVVQVAHAGERLSRGAQRRVDGYRALIRRTYLTSSSSTQNALAVKYFDARREFARTRLDRLRFGLYAFSLATPDEVVRRLCDRFRTTSQTLMSHERSDGTGDGCEGRNGAGANLDR